jgi:hypothetical protein
MALPPEESVVAGAFTATQGHSSHPNDGENDSGNPQDVQCEAPHPQGSGRAAVAAE